MRLPIGGVFLQKGVKTPLPPPPPPGSAAAIWCEGVSVREAVTVTVRCLYRLKLPRTPPAHIQGGAHHLLRS